MSVRSKTLHFENVHEISETCVLIKNTLFVFKFVYISYAYLFYIYIYIYIYIYNKLKN